MVNVKFPNNQKYVLHEYWCLLPCSRFDVISINLMTETVKFQSDLVLTLSLCIIAFLEHIAPVKCYAFLSSD